MHAPKKILTCVDIIEQSEENREDTEVWPSVREPQPLSKGDSGLLERYKKLLVLEIGSEELVESALTNPSGWRGRAERIAELEEKLQRLPVWKRDAPTLIVDRKRTTELESTLKQMENSIKHLEVERLSLKSRIKSLESSLKCAREDIQTLIQRERLNSQVPILLREFILNNYYELLFSHTI